MSIPLAFIGVIIIWSTTPLAIKWSGEEAGFLFGVTARMVIGAALCVALLVILRKPLPLHRSAMMIYLAGSIAGFGSMSAVYWGATYIPSGWISLIFGLTPMMTALLSQIFLRQKEFSIQRVVGMSLALLGLWQIFVGEQNIQFEQASLGIGLVLLAVLLHAISTVWMQSLNSKYNLPALSITTGILLIIVPMYLFSLFLTDFHWPTNMSLRGSMSILYLGVVGSVLGFFMFFYILKHVSATQVGLITLLTPVTALLLGNTFNNELISIEIWLATALIMLGLTLFQWGESMGRFLQVVVFRRS